MPAHLGFCYLDLHASCITRLSAPVRRPGHSSKMSGASSRSLARTSSYDPLEIGTESKVRFDVPQGASTVANRRTTVYDAVAGV